MKPSLKQNLDYLAACFFEAGILNWVVSPGSRNAPIVAALVKHGAFKLHSFPDERAAAFAAMGLSISQNYPCGVICTSGTAAANFYPAVCEAFYQRVPLMVVTADRPEHLIDQWDGQTIHQKNIYGQHIRYQIHINASSCDFNFIETSVYESVEKSLQPVGGPVHINIALDDPIYQDIENNSEGLPSPNPFVFAHSNPTSITIDQINRHLGKAKKILILVGQKSPGESISIALRNLETKFPILSDICSEQINIGINFWDSTLTHSIPADDLVPDLILSIGMAMISKPLKQWLSSHKPKHIHISEFGEIGDPFGTKPIWLNHHPADFLTALDLATEETTTDFLNLWSTFCKQSEPKLPSKYINEFQWVKKLMAWGNSETVFHFGNSMSIRYASWVGKSEARILSNRGTSGIDGSLSTAVGFALGNPSTKNIVILGDISAIYDAHALWCNELPKNLTIIVLNNFGGQIFNWIQGPSKVQEMMPFIETPNHLNFEHLSAFYGLPFTRFTSKNSFVELLTAISVPSTQFIEIQSI